MTINDKGVKFSNLSAFKTEIDKAYIANDKDLNLTDYQKVQALNNLIGKEYSPSSFSGLGKKILPKNIQNVSGVQKNIMLQSFFLDGDGLPLNNTIFVIQYDYTITSDITIPNNCVLEFSGGSIDGEYTFYGNKCKVIGESRWGNSITYCDIYDNDGPILSIAKVTNKTYFGESTDTDVDVLSNLNDIIADISNTYGEITLVFEKGVTYDFGQAILLRDNMTINGNGCTILFHSVNNENGSNVTMYPYSGFFTNRKIKSTGGTINDYAVGVKYAEKNITIKNINFSFASLDNEFWFFKNSERGVIAINGAKNIRIENCKFNNVRRTYPIWTADVEGIVIEGCEMTTHESLHQVLDTCGILWAFGYTKNAEISHCKAVCYNDEIIAIYGLKGVLNVHDNEFVSDEHISITIPSGESPSVYLENNIFSPDRPTGQELDTAFGLSIQNEGDRNMSLLLMKNNIINHSYGVILIHGNNYLTVDRIIVDGNKFNDDECGINNMRVLCKDIKFVNNYCAKGIKAVTSIGVNDGFSYIKNNETGIIADKDSTDLNNLPISNSISYIGTTIVSGNTFYGTINFTSSAYSNTLIFNDNNCIHGYFKPLSNKRNVINSNFFRNHYMSLAPEANSKFGNNIIIDKYNNLLNTGSYTLSQIDTAIKYHSIGEFILVDEKLARVTSEGYRFVESGDSGTGLVLNLKYTDNKHINYNDYSIVSFNGETKATLTGATFNDGTTEKTFEGYQNPGVDLIGGTAELSFTISIENKAAVRSIILNGNPFTENFKISDLSGATGLEKILFLWCSKAIGDISNILSILPSLTTLWLVGTNITGNLAILSNCTNLGNDWGLVANQTPLHGDVSSIPGNVVYFNLPSWTKDSPLVASGYEGLTWTLGNRTGSTKSILCLNSASTDQRFASSEDVDNYFIDNAACTFNGGEYNYINLFVLGNYTPSAAASTAIATLKLKGVTDIKVNQISL